MSGDDAARLTAALMMLVLVGSSLSLRRLRPTVAIRLIGSWLGIFGLAFVLFTFRDEGRAVWQRVAADVTGEHGRMIGRRLQIQIADDGHFWVRGEVNAVPTEFLVDSGATTTALSSAVADKARLDLDAIPIAIETANGRVSATTTRVAALQVGGIVQNDARAVVSPAFGNTNVLGMSFLSALKSWKVENRTLTLEP